MLLIGPESVVTVQGQCYGDMSKYRAERSTQVWTVNCPCGTKEDDGERMTACDYCEVWQHTRCVGISDTEDVPTEYVYNV
jgi:ferredoxin-thioredoxin reductase catalytic subunit